MENATNNTNNVVTIDGSGLVSTTTNVGINENNTSVGNVGLPIDYTTIQYPYQYGTQYYWPPINLEVQKAENGYVIYFNYKTYIAKNEKELNKITVQLLNPNKGKKKNGKT